ncbi:unnamed protein product [Spirodela intermedia]|uniref:C2H2-type domain-containing protein n=1 Tax=Spirodela intermedia TaxID=51605 RepID=A0A7I8JB10_SPIIN|nr:unnamed protein product [Spirodela intermedia]CAA6667347.1 unnamed protein product [Spirodela intermedia]
MRLQTETEREAAAAASTWARTGLRSLRVFVPDCDSAEEETAAAMAETEEVLRVAISMESSTRGVVEREESPETKKMKMAERRAAATAEEEKVLCLAISRESSRRGVAEKEGSPETKKRKPASPTGREHKCNECGRSFTTGQALGGHKRKHWKGLPAGVRSLELDLNSPPPAREEEEGPIPFFRFL